MLVDGSAIMNVMLVGILRKLGKSQKEFKGTNMEMTNFIGESIDALEFYIAELTVRTKTSSTVFLAMDAKPRYSLILGRDWIHSNMYVPSTLHQ